MSTNEAITSCLQPNTGQPIVIQVVGNGDTGSVKDTLRYNRCVPAILGSLHICFGVLSIVLSAIAGQSDFFAVRIGYGFWIPVLWFISGGFGFGMAYVKNKVLVTTFMTMSIISACSMIFYIVFASITLICALFENAFTSQESEHTDECSKLATLKGFVILIGVCQALNSISSAVFGCSIVCCGASKTTINAQTIEQIRQIAIQASTSQGATAQPLEPKGLENIELQGLAPSAPDLDINKPPTIKIHENTACK